MTEPSFRTFAWRVVVAHMVTYFVVGLLAFVLFDYRTLYVETELRHLMRPTDSPWVAAGPMLQVFRGGLFACVLWPFAEPILTARRGVLHLYGLMLGLAVLGTAGPAPGSLEGLIFTTVPVPIQLVGLPEVIVQTAAFSWLVVAWCRTPARWMNVVASVALALIVLMGVAGLLVGVA